MNNKGQGLVEYALILVLTAVVVIVVLAILGPLVANVFKALDSNQQPQQPQEINPSDYWKEVVPPPAYNGKCYMYSVDRYHELAITVWCVPNEDL